MTRKKMTPKVAGKAKTSTLDMPIDTKSIMKPPIIISIIKQVKFNLSASDHSPIIAIAAITTIRSVMEFTPKAKDRFDLSGVHEGNAIGFAVQILGANSSISMIPINHNCRIVLFLT